MAKTVREIINDPGKVWREGSRIRRGDSSGYADRVPDETIWQHLAGDIEKRDLDAIFFRSAVLRLREQERDQREHRRILDSITADADGPGAD